jgi:hypothetical protein
MDLKKGIAAILLASVALAAAPAAMAHDPKEHEREAREAEMTRVPVQIQPAPAPVVVAPAPELPKIRFAELDKDNDRKITRKEWRGKGSAFRKLDKNKDGVLAGVEVEVPVKAEKK